MMPNASSTFQVGGRVVASIGDSARAVPPPDPACSIDHRERLGDAVFSHKKSLWTKKVCLLGAFGKEAAIQGAEKSSAGVSMASMRPIRSRFLATLRTVTQ